MALDQSALTDLLDALRSRRDLDFIREAMQFVLQALIELEATQAIGAARYDRTDTRNNTRNGSSDPGAHRPRWDPRVQQGCCRASARCRLHSVTRRTAGCSSPSTAARGATPTVDGRTYLIARGVPGEPEAPSTGTGTNRYANV